MCFPTGLSREEPFRLVNNNSTCKGTVEVHYHGMWVPACGDSWSMKTSHAVCRQLNCGVAKWESAPAEKEPLYTFQSCPAINISCGELGSQEEHCLVQLSVSRTCCSGKLAHITCTGRRPRPTEPGLTAPLGKPSLPPGLSTVKVSAAPPPLSATCLLQGNDWSSSASVHWPDQCL